MPPVFPLEEFTADTVRTEARPAPAQPQTPSIAPEEAERMRLAGYEAGYQAGWDDAIRQGNEEQARITADFARNIQDLGFTFHEARAHVMHTLEPLLKSMVEKVLPKLVSDTLGQTIMEELLPLAANAADSPIELVMSPSCRATIEPLLQHDSPLPITLVEEETLAEGQVFFRLGNVERHLDLDATIERIGAAIHDLYQLNERTLQNG